jgi:hypothetical protein
MQSTLWCRVCQQHFAGSSHDKRGQIPMKHGRTKCSVSRPEAFYTYVDFHICVE